MTDLLLRETPDGHAEKVIVVARETFLLFFEGSLLLIGGPREFALGEGPELEQAELVNDDGLFPVGNDELLGDNHVDEARLVRELLVLICELFREVLLLGRQVGREAVREEMVRNGQEWRWRDEYQDDEATRTLRFM